MKIGIIGALGFIGKNIALSLKKDFEIIEITKSNYRSHVGEEFDILINANGNSTKFLANRYPERDFKTSVTTVIDSFSHFKYDKYIYISTIDAEKNIDIYGLNRYLAEQIVERYCDNWLVIRCCAVIGKDARKGVVNDIVTNQEVYLTPDSKLQLIAVTEVAKKIKEYLYSKRNEIIRLYSSDNITVQEITNVLSKKLHVNEKAKKIIYDYDTDDSQLKTSLHYLNDILK